MEHAENYLHTGILTKEAFQEIKNVALSILSKKDYHQFLNIDKEHLANELAEHAVERLPRFDATRKKSVRTFILVCMSNNLRNRVRDSFLPKRHGEFVKRFSIEDGEEIDVLDEYSFSLTNARDTAITSDSDFIVFCLNYWRKNLGLYFKKRTIRRKVAEKILNALQTDSPTNLLITTHAENVTKNYVLSQMAIVNRAMYQQWKKANV